MKVVLLNPPSSDKKKYIREGRCTQEIGVWGTLWPPISLAIIAALLREDGHQVKIFDCPAQNISLRGLESEIIIFKPDAVIWATGTSSIKNDLGVGEFIKHNNQSIRTIIFGTHVTVLDISVLTSRPSIDVIIRNEPEVTCLELMNAYDQKRSLEGINGITFRKSDGAMVRNKDREFMKSLDSLPLPAWDLVDLSKYRLPLKGEKFLIINPVRGCPFECIFCTSRIYYGNKIRKKSIDRVIEEIKNLISRFGVNNFLIWSDTFTVDKNYVAKFCQKLIDENLDVHWACNSRVDTVDEFIIGKMAESGCWMISYGVESFNQNVLYASKKKIEINDIKKAVCWSKKAKIKVVGHFMFGLPGETMESMTETLKQSKKLGFDFVQFYTAVPYPGTEFHMLSQKNGWIEEFDWSKFSQDYANVHYPNLSSREIQKFRKKAYRKFYLTFRNFFKIFQTFKLKGIKNIFIRMINFLRWTS